MRNNKSMTEAQFKEAGLHMTHEVELFYEDGDSVFLKYWLSADYKDGYVSEVFVHTDWIMDFSFKSSSYIPKYMLETAEMIIKGEWNENI